MLKNKLSILSLLLLLLGAVIFFLFLWYQKINLPYFSPAVEKIKEIASTSGSSGTLAGSSIELVDKSEPFLVRGILSDDKEKKIVERFPNIFLNKYEKVVVEFSQNVPANGTFRKVDRAGQERTYMGYGLNDAGKILTVSIYVDQQINEWFGHSEERIGELAHIMLFTALSREEAQLELGILRDEEAYNSSFENGLAFQQAFTYLYPKGLFQLEYAQK